MKEEISGWDYIMCPSLTGKLEQINKQYWRKKNADGKITAGFGEEMIRISLRNGWIKRDRINQYYIMDSMEEEDFKNNGDITYI